MVCLANRAKQEVLGTGRQEEMLLRDQAIRVKAGIPLSVAAYLCGVSRPTLSLFEADPMAVRSTEKREKCAAFYARLRRFLVAFEQDAADQ